MTPINSRTCDAHGLRYDATRTTGCVLCQREQREGSLRPSRPVARPGLVLGFALVLVAAGVFAFREWSAAHPESPFSTVAAPATTMLATTNSIGRSGAYYVPRQHAERIPLLVFLHGTGGSGASAIPAFRDLADKEGFGVLAPDSGASPSGALTWQVGQRYGEVTDDRRHVMACLREMVEREHLVLDPAHVLVVGHSGGGSSAPYLATNEEPFTAFAVLHGGSFPAGFGGRQVPGWYSTGSGDTIRTPSMVQAASDEAKKAGERVEMRTFPGGHELGAEELAALVKWWLAQ